MTNDLEHRDLQDWYLTLNRIYLDRNFHRNRFEIFTHLSEIVGGLSLLSSKKKKAGVNPELFVPKALAWWMALCGKVGIRDVSDMIWWKFPNVCPYCQKKPHDELRCKIDPESNHLDWRKLDELARRNESQRPHSLAQWQRMFYDIYGASKSESYSSIFGRFSEELGELAETLRIAPIAPSYFLSEASDLFAWLMKLQNLLDLNEERGNVGETLNKSFAVSYPDKCLDCNNPVCTCRPILPGTLGRIAHELPEGHRSFAEGGVLISLNEAMELFSTGANEVVLGGNTIPVTLEMVQEIRFIISEIKQNVLGDIKESSKNSELLYSAIEKIEGLAAAQRVTQDSLDKLINAIAQLPSEERQIFMNFLTNISAGPWVALLLDSVKHVF